MQQQFARILQKSTFPHFPALCRDLMNKERYPVSLAWDRSRRPDGVNLGRVGIEVHDIIK